MCPFFKHPKLCFDVLTKSHLASIVKFLKVRGIVAVLTVTVMLVSFQSSVQKQIWTYMICLISSFPEGLRAQSYCYYSVISSLISSGASYFRYVVHFHNILDKSPYLISKGNNLTQVNFINYRQLHNIFKLTFHH